MEPEMDFSSAIHALLLRATLDVRAAMGITALIHGQAARDALMRADALLTAVPELTENN